LDSLADVISFGIVPGVIMYIFLCNAFQINTNPVSQFSWYAMPAFFITVFSAYRLGKFNLDDSKEGGFTGLNTPSNTIFFIGLLWLYKDNVLIYQFLLTPWILYTLIVSMSFLMVSPLKMFSFKVKSYQLKDNIYRIALLFGIILLIIFVGKAAVSLSIVWYLLLSLIQQLYANSAEHRLET
jgi:CDP-diacylglycerol--serine O-phosphatidyltransferase